MSFIDVFIAFVLAMAFLLFLRIQWSKLEITRQGCAINIKLIPDYPPDLLISDMTTFVDGTGLILSVPEMDIPYDADKLSVFSLSVVRVPRTNIRVGTISYIIDQQGHLVTQKKRVTCIGGKILI